MHDARLRPAFITPVAVLVFVLALSYRFLIMGGALGGFDNDQFVNLSYAQQIVLGDRPTRDYIEPGRPLTHFLSAAAQMAIGRTLFAEAAFTVTMLALSSALLFALAYRASGSLLIALAVALVQIGMAPRHYNYPKLLAYAVAIPVIWAYIDRPNQKRLFLVAAAGAFAFLLRHDHGLYVAVGAVAAVLLIHRSQLRRAAVDICLLGAMTLALVSPYLAYTQSYQNVIAYFRAGFAFAERTSERTSLIEPSFTIDSSYPLIVHVPPQPSPSRRVWLTSFLTQWHILPGVMLEENAIPFLYYLLVVPPVLVLVLVLTRADGAITARWTNGSEKIAVVALVALAMGHGILRGNLAARLADVSEVAGILIAWVAAVLLARRSVAGRLAAMAVVVLVFALSAVSVQALEDVTSQVTVTGVYGGVNKVVDHARDVYKQLQAIPPVDAWGDRPGNVRVARYLHDCTRPTDRLLVVGYDPELFYMAGRGFAAGSPWILPEFFTTNEERRVMLRRVQSHRVPIVLTSPEPEYTEEYVSSFPVLDAFLNDNYREVGTVDFGDRFDLRVLVRRTIRPVRDDPVMGLPCFAN